MTAEITWTKRGATYVAIVDGITLAVYREAHLRGWTIDIAGEWFGSSCHLYCGKEKAIDEALRQLHDEAPAFLRF